MSEQRVCKNHCGHDKQWAVAGVCRHMPVVIYPTDEAEECGHRCTFDEVEDAPAKCIHCDPEHVPDESGDDWCNCRCHENESYDPPHPPRCEGCGISHDVSQGCEDAVIQRSRKADSQENKALRVIAGGLRLCIQAHGAINPEWTGSAAKRVYRMLRGEGMKNVLLAMNEALSSRCAGGSPGEEFGYDSEYHKLWNRGYYEKASEWIKEQLSKRERPDAALNREAQRARVAARMEG